MPTCPAPCVPPKKIPAPVCPKKDITQLLEPNFPDNCVKWNQKTNPPCRGMYTFVSTPKPLYNSKKLMKQFEADAKREG